MAVTYSRNREVDWWRRPGVGLIQFIDSALLINFSVCEKIRKRWKRGFEVRRRYTEDSSIYFQISLPKMNPSKHIAPIRTFITIPNQKIIGPCDRLLRVANCRGTSPVFTPLTAIQIQNAAPSKKRNRSVPEYWLVAITAAKLSGSIAWIIACSRNTGVGRQISRISHPCATVSMCFS